MTRPTFNQLRDVTSPGHHLSFLKRRGVTAVQRRGPVVGLGFTALGFTVLNFTVLNFTVLNFTVLERVTHQPYPAPGAGHA